MVQRMDRQMIGRVRYKGDYYRVMFEKGCLYDLIEITEDGLYKVYSDAFDDWGLFSPDEFEQIESDR